MAVDRSGMGSLVELWRRYERRRRFWRLVDVQGPDEHWCWRGPVDEAGQGWYRGRRVQEVAYDLARGALPEGATLRQQCGLKACVNPEHLEAHVGRFPRRSPPAFGAN